VERYVKLFYIGMFAPMLLIIPMVMLEDYALLLCAAMVFIIGIATIIFPFVTPQTVLMFGLKKGIRIGKWCGYSMLLIGAVILVMFVLMR